MTASDFLSEVRRLAGNIDGTPDCKYTESDLGEDVLSLLTDMYSCKTCGGMVADGRGVSYAGSLYHREQCIPPDLKLCTHCDLLEDSRRVGPNGVCEACTHAKTKQQERRNDHDSRPDGR